MHPEEKLTLTSEELQKRIKDEKNLFLLDVREPEEYAESHISGCKLIPLGELQKRAQKEVPTNLPIVTYCAHGRRSMSALRILQHLGYQNIQSLDGGIVAWHEYQKNLNGRAKSF